MATDPFMRFLASWALVHETADEGWKAAVERGAEQEPGQIEAGPDAFVDGLSALVAEEKERLKAQIARGELEGSARHRPRRAHRRTAGSRSASCGGVSSRCRRPSTRSPASPTTKPRPAMSARSRQVAWRLGRAWFGGLVEGRFGLAGRARLNGALARRTRIAFQDLGPAFIKLGQMISVRADLVPAEWVFEMERLQDSVPAVPAEAIRRVIRPEFGAEPEELFAEWDDAPIASASIAQVHRARLRAAYRPVVGEPLPAGRAGRGEGREARRGELDPCRHRGSALGSHPSRTLQSPSPVQPARAVRRVRDDIVLGVRAPQRGAGRRPSARSTFAMTPSSSFLGSCGPSRLAA